MKYLKRFNNHAKYLKHFEKNDAVIPLVATCEDEEHVHYMNNDLNYEFYKGKYLTFIALQDGIFNFNGTATANTLSYSLDNGSTWTVLDDILTVTSGSKILWKGNCTPQTNTGIGKFSSGGKFDVEGNVMSLLFGDDFKGQTSLEGKSNALIGLFRETDVVSAENLSLPATTLANYCYDKMFESCTSLTTAPQLPATTLTERCYRNMFRSCTSLTTAPQLPATTLASYCYTSMFYGCTSLTTSPELPAITLANNCYQYMFQDCTSLVTAPQLPATTLADYCYYFMFNGCTSLTEAPELPATTLADYCYQAMFASCTSLTEAPKLPATTLASSCYFGMFSGCTGLITAPPVLSATTLADSCCKSMFYGCISLTTTPQLPATTLADSCYSNMFNGCVSLTTAPKLPATTLVTYCYESMFEGCTSLTTAPELPATTLVSNCYYRMFNGCTNLLYIKALFTTSPNTLFTAGWVDGVAASGTFIKNKTASWTSTGVNGVPTGWAVGKDYSGDYLTFTASEAGTFTFTNPIEYSIDSGSTWVALPANLASPTVTANSSILWRAKGLTRTLSNGIGRFTSTGTFSVSGNIMSLVNGSDFALSTTEVGPYQFYRIFYLCTNLLSAEYLCLPATKLSNYCYSGMFYSCSNLTTAPPVLPATELANFCYYSMFQDCSRLTTAPSVLPATTLASNCYNSMFYFCVMLTTAPVLPAITLISNCYKNMFGSCTILNYIKAMFTTEPSTTYTLNWVSSIAASGTFVKNSAATWTTTGANGVPSGWTVTTASA